MFEGSGFTVNNYPYYDPATGGLRFEDMLHCLKGLAPRSIVLLHACCHNPTGVDLTSEQWNSLIFVLRERKLLPYLDLAYQGFGDGVEEDAHSVRALAASGLTFFVANSFSKSMSVYGERCGALSAVCASKAEADLVMGQLRYTVRRIYSSPAIHAARIVAHVLGDADLRAMWEGELAQMRLRMVEVRQMLHARLSALRPDRDFSFLISQRGMFSYTGLSAEQVDCLREEHAVYLIRSGRMCVAGLTQTNVDRVAMALSSVT
jgi:aromatic-amino-acid transaminase